MAEERAGVVVELDMYQPVTLPYSTDTDHEQTGSTVAYKTDSVAMRVCINVSFAQFPR